MKKVIVILLLIFFAQEKYSAQSIFISKDSLKFFQTESNYDLADTFYIANLGDSNLIIDSIKTEHGYGYQVEMKNNDTTIYINLINFEPIEIITLEPQDSFRVVFSNPDLCPICGSSNIVTFFTDTVTFYSNSIINSEYQIRMEGDGFTDIKIRNSLFQEFQLYQNYPNPFNPTTTINYFLSKSGFINLSVFNLLGEKVATLVNNYQTAGLHIIKFNSKELASGIYIYRLNNGDKSLTKKMILLR